MKQTFWKEAVVYQIYPRSFKDSNGDGIGDIPGIVSKLDYLRELGVDVIWLSPVYSSPNDDNGYDISDYRNIHEEFGTLTDWEALTEGLHKRGMKLVMDLVVNHTSDEHAWFEASRESKDSPFREYYYWREGKDGQEPNNWTSVFSGSAWEYDEKTEAYFLHLFSKKQPDLNWESPKVRREVYEMMRWWLDKGVDGFRMDVINFISKTPELPSVGEDRYAWGGDHFMNGPKLMDYLLEMKREVLDHYEVMTVGEMPGVNADQAVEITDEENGALNMVFQFEHVDIGSGPGGKFDLKPWTLHELRGILHKWQIGLADKGWNSLYLNNHDQPRMVSRFGDDGEYRVLSAKMLATLLHTLKGTPYIYQGEELGMTNVSFERIDQYQDIETLNMYREATELHGKAPADVLRSIHVKGRDNARTPMQWDASANGGFTTGSPWLGVNPNYTDINAEAALQDTNSIFYYYKELIRLRKQHPIMVYGAYSLYLENDENIYAYSREWEGKEWAIVLNFARHEVSFSCPDHWQGRSFARMTGNYDDTQIDRMQDCRLRPFEALVLELDS
ncbi:alpha-glucosidase [Paenibacillus sp. UMB4589-SE434]|uniref:glycoside hydrolase family 13 protein n=1 Tax=Paenibacillus sp. UMB4589-SE434 TaxID=3046314 RepID=UPI00254D4658|nr:alpha-glucosidase [Paenibacillus sp. UMB4589-SE434]MDK8183972.1 alpha-glucosidase [Paenibacillus sp. UMB4589-SE434]